MHHSIFPIFFCFAMTISAFASDLKISNELLFVEGERGDRTMYAILNVEWKNAWKNDQNNDAVWLFGKFLMGPNGYQHVPLLQTGHEVIFNDQ